MGLIRWCNLRDSGRNLSFLLDGSFFQTTQHFRDAPDLGDAAARRERGLGIEDFAD